ncbi:Acyl-ACP thioesterase protein [Dioscorea alata]|uniref:Acyl-ACP thioesterase protein n=1 Tax=Dioscorea alata TaxID=55571 RepID=A0ACB7WE88_DIOAL|nr:Acyl-ACP thioesterase protein [Dioscorea alata]
MATSSFAFFSLYSTTKCSSLRENDPNNNKSSVRVNGTSIHELSNFSIRTSPAYTSVASVIEDLMVEKNRQNIPTEKRMVDPFRQGLIVEGGVGYRQTITVRSYEIGPDKTATLETLFNLLQETALNHVWMSGLLGDGFGATHGMIKNNLIWVVTRMHVQIDEYPIWGEVVEIETWVGSSGKNGMRRDWLIRSHLSGHVFARATSTWVMMNQETRRLSKMPQEVRDEISPWYIEKQAIIEDVPEKIIKLDNKAKYVDSNLKPKRSDMDMNNHVNNVKYVKWMLETIPVSFLEEHQLGSIILEYRRECGSSDIVESICEPDEEQDDDDDSKEWPKRFTHLLQNKGEEKNEEIVRGRTTWNKKLPTCP